MKRACKLLKKAAKWYFKQMESAYFCPSGMIPMNYIG
jgi:hypothetical protein